MDKKVFKCMRCCIAFSIKDVEQGFYFPSTGICLNCYREMAKSRGTCFAKKSLYDPATPECQFECPDRNICKTFVAAKKAA